MMDMPRPRPPNLHRETTRHGRVVWYVRVNKGQRIRLKADYGTPAFQQEYDTAIKGEKPVAAGKAKPNTLKWLIERYLESSAWATGLAASTRRQRGNIFKHVIASAGNDMAAKITKKTIQAGVDRRRATPDAARHFLLSMRGLFRWAVSADHASAIRPKASSLSAAKPMAIKYGRRNGAPNMKPAGRSARESASGTRSSIVRDCAGVMPCASAGRTSRMAAV